MSGNADEVLAAQARKFAAKVARDPAVLEELLADDLIYVHANGEVDDKRSFMASVVARGYLSFDLKEAKIRMFADAAIVTGLADIHVNAELSFEAMFTDVWVRRDGWRNVSWQTTIRRPV